MTFGKKKYLDFTMNKTAKKIIAKNIKLRGKKSSIDKALNKKEPTHKCLANMQEHKLSDCPSLKGFRKIKL